MEAHVITQERLREVFDYDQYTGIFVWRKPTARGVHIGAVAGCRHHNGYTVITLDKKQHLAHRLAWIYMNGNIDPDICIDHEDTDRSNNRFKNLRLATYSQNQHNRKLNKNNTTGVKGVSWNPDYKRYLAIVNNNRKRHHVGYFDTVEEASDALMKYRENLHKEFHNHGIHK